ncbi:MAG: hypothetical protein SV375_05185 [Thermodesulfobacteriota bacterium]|nr:hypothetical protein [Thermodesulfobacteriota bacterium]
MHKIVCPECGADFDLREAQAEGEWAEIIRLLPSFGEHGKLVFEYAELFNIKPLRVRAKKLLRLIAETATLFRVKKFSYRKKEYTISSGGIVEAITTVCNKQFDGPLENHNYLKRVMIGIAERELKEERDRVDREQRDRERRHTVRRNPGPDKGVTAAEHKARHGIESLVNKIGTQIDADENDKAYNGRVSNE